MDTELSNHLKNPQQNCEKILNKENGETDHNTPEKGKIGTDPNFKRKIVWKNAIGFLILHMLALYGLYLMITLQVKWFTVAWMFFIGYMSGKGVTMGAHRLFAHKSYKATFSLRLILIIMQTLAGQNCMYIWVRDHRLHHKFSDTDADPHNASRGFFFSHIGWLMSKKHPLVKEKGKTLDMSDLEADELVMWQKKHYKLLYLFVAIIFPVSVPVIFWGETSWNSFFVSYIYRYVVVLNHTWLVNSAAHLFGTKPFDKYILPSENGLVSFMTGGEGWHNYHHVFPWDYRTSEYGSRFNVTAVTIELAEFFGLAYDLKTAPFKMIERRSLRTGDGNHPLYKATKVKTFRWGEETERPFPSKDEGIENRDINHIKG